MDSSGLWAEAWELFKQNIGVLCLASVVVTGAGLACLGISLLLNENLIVGSIVDSLVVSPLYAGLMSMGVAIARGHRPAFSRVFLGFTRYPTLIAVIVASALVKLVVESPVFLVNAIGHAHPSMGMACFSMAMTLLVALPLSLFFSVRLWFAPVLCLDRTLGEPGAGLSLGTSWAVTGRNFWPLLGLLIVSGFIDLGGVLLLGAGLVVLSIPLTTCAFGVAYTRIMDSVERTRCPECGCDISASANGVCPVCGVNPPGSAGR